MKKIYNKRGKFVLATNEVDLLMFDVDEFKEQCENSDIEYTEEKYYNWCKESAEEFFDDDLDAIRRHEAYRVPVLITGTLGLWWGHPEIEPVRMESVYEAIMKCIGEDGVYVNVEWVDGRIEVSVTHHDGTNLFTIRALSKKGLDRESGEYVEEDFEKLDYLYA